MILGAMAIVSDWVHFYLAAIKIKVWIVVKTIVGITMRLEMLIKKAISLALTKFQEMIKTFCTKARAIINEVNQIVQG